MSFESICTNCEYRNPNAILDWDFYASLKPLKRNNHQYDIDNFTIDWKQREQLRLQFGMWNYPTMDVIDELATFIGDDNCLEIGAGAGAWSHMLQTRNVNIVATDNMSEHDEKSKLYTRVYNLSATDAVNKFKSCNVLLSVWPRDFLDEALKNFTGRKFIFVGEIDGCTGFINENDYGFRLVKNIEHYKSYSGLHDKVLLYER